MENAAKSLLMAAGVLIGILILSLAVYLFITFGQDAKAINERIEDAQLTKYNSQFNVYFGRNNIKVHDILSLVNLAQENNNYYMNYGNYSESYEIKIIVNGLDSAFSTDTGTWNEAKKQNFIKEYGKTDNSNGELKYTFLCNERDVLYHSNGRVAKICFNIN